MKRLQLLPSILFLLIASFAMARDRAQPVLTASSLPFYPPVARVSRLQGTVLVRMTVTPDGRVADVKVASGPKLLGESAAENVRSWKFEPPGAAMEEEVTFVYRIASKAVTSDFPYVKVAFFGIRRVEIETNSAPSID